jgi:glucuronokinase
VTPAEGRAPARVGLLGNPSDGYGGRTLALAVPRFEAVVTAEPSDGVEVVPGPQDQWRWPSPSALVADVDRFGYGTGPTLLAASLRTWLRWLADEGRTLPGDGVRLRYRTSIPRQVGLAGSSALVVATLRALSDAHGVAVPEHLLPSLALRAEVDELGLSAGLQDRVVQCAGGLVAMDFGHLEHDGRHGLAYGRYESLDPAGLPPLFLAWHTGAAEPSSGYHGQLRARFERGDVEVRQALRGLAALVVEGRAALRWGDHARFAVLIGRNMDLRRRLGPLPGTQLALVEVAEDRGLCATFAGSGGAVVGVLGEGTDVDELAAAYAGRGAELVVLG